MKTQISTQKLNLLKGFDHFAAIQNFGEQVGFTSLLGEWGFNTHPQSYVFLEPLLSLTIHSQGSSVKTANGKTLFESKDVWAALREYLLPKLNQFNCIDTPFCAGFFSYEVLHLLEELPFAKEIGSQLPLAQFFLYGKVLELSQKPKPSALLHQLDLDLEPFWQISDLEQLIHCEPKESKQHEPNLQSELRSNFRQAQYQQMVEDTRDLIRKGDVYQVNLSQRFELRSKNKLNPQQFFKDLLNLSQARYAAFIRNDQTSSILSASPELFLSCYAQKLFCSPIKGTSKRAESAEEDLELMQKLQSSEKDRAELAMIVDLVRNDMGRIAHAGSVEVLQHARIDSLPYLHHLVSDISSNLLPDLDLVDVIKALFPCGSISGAPKIAAMKIISAFEGISRGVYCGAIGHISSARSFKFNVAIRSGLLKDNKLIFHGGGGIVYDSDALCEYNESLSKASIFLKAFNASTQKSSDFD